MKKVKNVMQTKDKIVQWIRNYMASNGGKNTPIIIGISGGKDSSVVAALCVEAVGRKNVIGVLMPNGEQKDIDVSRSLVRFLGIPSYEINIADTLEAMQHQIANCALVPNDVYKFNTPARVRMTMLYGIAAIHGGRVANTCNYTESYLGYDTKFGDQCGDFAPISDILCTDVIRIGKACGLPDEFVNKAPDDGMCGKTDEERFGFTYEEADKYLNGENVFMETTAKIVKMFENSRHKNCIFIPHYVDLLDHDTCCCSTR